MTRDPARGVERPSDAANATDESSDRTRRSLLHAGATGLAVLGGLAGSASARTIRCPRSVEYWRTHPGEWPSFSEEVCLLLLEEEGEQLFVHPAKNKQRLVAELEKSPGGDCYLELAHRYLAARVNRRHVRPYPEGHADFWDWVERYNRWVEWADRPQDDWTAGGVDGSAVKRYFERWNEGVGGPCAARSLSGSAFGVDRV